MEKKNFDHVILTRFSVTFTPDQPTPDDAWLLYRLGFFEAATCASLRAQTDSDFTWLVFFDHRAPEWLRQDIAEISDGLFVPVWIDSFFSVAQVQRAVEAHTSRDFLVTTRLDSDDALANDFVAAVAQHFDSQDGTYINFLRGLQVDRSGQVFQFEYPANPFISYIEKRSPDSTPHTVFRSGRHGDAPKLGDVLDVATHPMWLQVVHGSNLMNEVRGSRVHPRSAEQHFKLDLDFDTSLSAPRLGLQKVRQWMRLCGTWARQPRLLALVIRGRLRYLAGTKMRTRINEG